MDSHDNSSRDSFEGLWLLRACYRFRSDYDARGTLTVNDAIAYGEQLLRQVHLHERRRAFGQTNRAA